MPPFPTRAPMTPFKVAGHFLGLAEVPGPEHNQLIAGMMALGFHFVWGGGVR